MSRICIPVNEVEGIHSKVSEYFGCSAAYLILDTETRTIRRVEGLSALRSCKKTFAFLKTQIDEVWCRYLRCGAASIIQAAGISIRRAEGDTVGDLFTKWTVNALPPISKDMLCDGQHCQQPVKAHAADQRCCAIH